MAKRNLQVQTPGEVPATAPAPDAAQDQDIQPAAAPAEQPVEPPKAAKPPKARADYASMAAADIDPHTLTAPVLSRDGWVVPAKKG
jgi:hypothetical protein